MINRPAGEAKMSFIDSRDIALVTAEILTKNNSGASQQHYENKAYDITGPSALSYGKRQTFFLVRLVRKYHTLT